MDGGGGAAAHGGRRGSPVRPALSQAALLPRNQRARLRVSAGGRDKLPRGLDGGQLAGRVEVHRARSLRLAPARAGDDERRPHPQRRVLPRAAGGAPAHACDPPRAHPDNHMDPTLPQPLLSLARTKSAATYMRMLRSIRLGENRKLICH